MAKTKKSAVRRTAPGRSKKKARAGTKAPKRGVAARASTRKAASRKKGLAKKAASRKKGAAKKKAPAAASVSGEELAKKQREISVSEFFAKNRHLLGFDNPSKALLTTIKELVDNSLDAADEARIPADVEILVDQLEDDRFRVTCVDNGPGIPAKNVPLVFGKLLYGSKFHRLKMSRGQQGIGVSAAGMYGLLTTGRPLKVTSRLSKRKPAGYFEISIDTQRNQPAVRKQKEVDWDRPHGTQVVVELEAAYRKGQHSVDNYVKQISLANPHATISYGAPDREKPGERTVYERVTKDLPPETAEIKPHPYGVELGVLMQMLRDTRSRNLSGFLASEFSRVSSKTAGAICENAGLERTRQPRRIDRADVEKLFRGISKTKIMSPPTDCIAPIGEALLKRALKAIHETEFTTAVTRRPSVYRGNPFLVEVAVAHGGQLGAEDPALCYRYANRVPLQYQQGGCAITRAVTSTDWKKYGLQQPRGSAPLGPLVIMVHIASVWVPFTSESKEAIAHYPEIIKEIKLGLQDCGRHLSSLIRRRRREADELKKRSYITQYIPHVAQALQEILEFSDRKRSETEKSLTNVLEKSRKL
jgi:DNA topoisomerase-6 subunit B